MSGSISDAERKESQAAEQGVLLHPAHWSRAEPPRAVPVSYADEPVFVDDDGYDDFYGYMSREEQHYRVHQAAVDYLYRNATGQRTSKPQIAEEFKVKISDLRWPLKVYRGYYERQLARQEAREMARLENFRTLPLFILNSGQEPLQVDYHTAISWWNAQQTVPQEAPRLQDRILDAIITTAALPWFEHRAQNPAMPPIIWETAVSIARYERYIDDGEQWRYLTWRKAHEGHRKVMEYFRGDDASEDDSEDAANAEVIDDDETLVEAVTRAFGTIDDADHINDFDYEELPQTP
jgi:hypothetical protein